MAEGILLAAFKKGIKVPKDLAVVGFDDIPSAAFTIPPLTTVRQPIYKKGEQAANMLINRIEGREEEISHLQLKPELIVRDSCGMKGSHPD